MRFRWQRKRIIVLLETNKYWVLVRSRESNLRSPAFAVRRSTDLAGPAVVKCRNAYRSQTSLLMCKLKQNWMKRWQYGKGLISFRWFIYQFTHGPEEDQANFLSQEILVSKNSALCHIVSLSGGFGSSLYFTSVSVKVPSLLPNRFFRLHPH